MKLPDGRLAKVIHMRIYIEPVAMNYVAKNPRYFDSMNEYASMEKRPYSVYREGLVPLVKGGKTVVQILDRYDQDHVVAEGVAYCNPIDNYNRSLGRTIALGRAMKQLTKEDK